jgi:chemotaxis signal transduction protein
MSVNEITETRQYLTFRLSSESFGIDVAKVREILDLTTITAIPRTPDFMRGVINLRGSVVPVVDLRLCFGMAKTESTRNTCIVVVEVMLERSHGNRRAGRFGGRGDRSGAGPDSAGPAHRHPDSHRLHPRHG